MVPMSSTDEFVVESGYVNSIFGCLHHVDLGSEYPSHNNVVLNCYSCVNFQCRTLLSALFNENTLLMIQSAEMCRHFWDQKSILIIAAVLLDVLKFFRKWPAPSQFVLSSLWSPILW
jgi:hypothetical protein